MDIETATQIVTEIVNEVASPCPSIVDSDTDGLENGPPPSFIATMKNGYPTITALEQWKIEARDLFLRFATQNRDLCFLLKYFCWEDCGDARNTVIFGRSGVKLLMDPRVCDLSRELEAIASHYNLGATYFTIESVYNLMKELQCSHEESADLMKRYIAVCYYAQNNTMLADARSAREELDKAAFLRISMESWSRLKFATLSSCRYTAIIVHFLVSLPIKCPQLVGHVSMCAHQIDVTNASVKDGSYAFSEAVAELPVLNLLPHTSTNPLLYLSDCAGQIFLDAHLKKVQTCMESLPAARAPLKDFLCEASAVLTKESFAKQCYEALTFSGLGSGYLYALSIKMWDSYYKIPHPRWDEIKFHLDNLNKAN